MIEPHLWLIGLVIVAVAGGMDNLRDLWQWGRRHLHRHPTTQGPTE